MRRIIIIAVVIALVTVCAILSLPGPKVEALVASVAVSSVTTNSEGRIIAQCIVTNASQRVLRVGGCEPLSADQTPPKPKPGRMMLIAVGQSVPFQMNMPRNSGRWRVSVWVYLEPGRVGTAVRGVADGLRRYRLPIPAYEPGFHSGTNVFSSWIE
jgi:hypothetical protein